MPDVKEISILELINGVYIKDHFGEMLVPSTYRLLDVKNDDSNSYLLRFVEVKNNKIYLIERGDKNSSLKRELLLELKYDISKRGTGVDFFIEDTDGDNIDEVYILFKATHSVYPRGIISINSLTGKINWKYEFGAFVEYVLFRDINGNGKKEIILSSAAVNNGANSNNISDLFSFVIEFDSKGKLLWKKKISDYFTKTYIFIANIDNENITEIIKTM